MEIFSPPDLPKTVEVFGAEVILEVLSHSGEVVLSDSLQSKVMLQNIIAPAGFWLRGQNPRRHPRSPRVYTYKNKEYLLKK